jgi:hypothetical protein
MPMDGKSALVLVIVSCALSMETQATMPFGRLMPLHYGPEDCRTVTPSKAELVTSPSSPSIALSKEDEVRDIVREESRCWNEHNLNGYMDLFWRSPSLVATIDGEQLTGWDRLMAAYRNGYTDPNKMGSVSLERITTQQLDSELFRAMSWFTLHQQTGDHPFVDSIILRRFPDGWKIVSAHSSTTLYR